MEFENFSGPENEPIEGEKNNFKEIDTGPTGLDQVDYILNRMGLFRSNSSEIARTEDDPFALKMIAESGKRDLLHNLGKNPNINTDFFIKHSARKYFHFILSLAENTNNKELAKLLIDNKYIKRMEDSMDGMETNQTILRLRRLVSNTCHGSP